MVWGLPPGSRVRAQLLGDYWAATIVALSTDGVTYTVKWDSDDTTCTVSSDQIRPLEQLKVGTMVWATDADGKERQATIKTMLARGYMVGRFWRRVWAPINNSAWWVCRFARSL